MGRLANQGTATAAVVQVSLIEGHRDGRHAHAEGLLEGHLGANNSRKLSTLKTGWQ